MAEDRPPPPMRRRHQGKNHQAGAPTPQRSAAEDEAPHPHRPGEEAGGSEPKQPPHAPRRGPEHHQRRRRSPHQPPPQPPRDPPPNRGRPQIRTLAGQIQTHAPAPNAEATPGQQPKPRGREPPAHEPPAPPPAWSGAKPRAQIRRRCRGVLAAALTARDRLAGGTPRLVHGEHRSEREEKGRRRARSDEATNGETVTAQIRRGSWKP